MNKNTLKTQLVLRNGTSAQWTAANPVLLKGELGLENDTRRMKIGDGITAWEDLPYATQEGGEIRILSTLRKEVIITID